LSSPELLPASLTVRFSSYSSPTEFFDSYFPSAEFKRGFGTEKLTNKHFTPLKAEDIDTSDDTKAMIVYAMSKGAADKKIWEIAHAYPDVDITISKCHFRSN
jgi:hypothetical protein